MLYLTEINEAEKQQQLEKIKINLEELEELVVTDIPTNATVGWLETEQKRLKDELSYRKKLRGKYGEKEKQLKKKEENKTINRLNIRHLVRVERVKVQNHRTDLQKQIQNLQTNIKNISCLIIKKRGKRSRKRKRSESLVSRAKEKS